MLFVLRVALRDRRNKLLVAVFELLHEVDQKVPVVHTLLLFFRACDFSVKRQTFLPIKLRDDCDGHSRVPICAFCRKSWACREGPDLFLGMVVLSAGWVMETF